MKLLLIEKTGEKHFRKVFKMEYKRILSYFEDPKISDSKIKRKIEVLASVDITRHIKEYISKAALELEENSIPIREWIEDIISIAIDVFKRKGYDIQIKISDVL